MKNLIASLRSGNWKALLACFLYFDTGFTAWVMFGPLAPFISKQISLSATQAGFLVAVPVLAASIVRVTFGNLFQSVNGRPLALLGISLSAIPALVLLLPVEPSYTLLLVLGVFLGVGGASFAIALPMAGSSYPPRVQGLVLGLAAAGNIGAVLDGFLFPGLASAYGWQHATIAVLPLLAISAVTVFMWAEDRSVKTGSAVRAFAGLAISIVGLIALVLLVNAGVFGPGKTGVMTGIIGAAGGIGGFYLPVVMSMAKESTGSYQPGFATFGVIAAVAFVLVAALQRQWLAWALAGEARVALEPTAALIE